MISFRLFGVRIGVAYSTVLLLTLAVISSTNESTVLMFFMSSLIHESGHLIPMLFFCGAPDAVLISMSEFNITCDMSNLSLSGELVISCGGVLLNLSISLFSFLLFAVFGVYFFFELAAVNACIGIFNALPISTFDGEAVLSLLLYRRFSDKTADTVIKLLSAVFMLPIGVLGFLELFSSANNYSLLFVFIYLISIIIIKEMR